MMKANLILWEDYLWKNFYPLSLTRPIFDLRAGVFSFFERAHTLLEESSVVCVCREEIRQLVEAKGVSCDFSAIDTRLPLIMFNGRALITQKILADLVRANVPTVMVSSLEPVAIFLPPGHEKLAREILPQIASPDIYSVMMSRLDVQEVETICVRWLWELVHFNEKFIENDFVSFLGREKISPKIDERAVLIGNDIFVGADAEICPGAVLDSREGPIAIGKGAIVGHNAVIMGPAVVGSMAQIMPQARIRPQTTIGPACRFGGEVEATISLGYSNKYHDGFIGHSYIGEWTNLGALTTNSDLKNNYGVVRVQTPWGEIDTGLNKVGCFIGDHTKLGIGTLIPTGAIAGVSVNFFGGGMMEKFIPSFIWGSANKYTYYDIDKALNTAKIVMERRNTTISDEITNNLRWIYEWERETRTDFIAKRL